MSLEITVRGTAEKTFAPERAVVEVAAVFEGPAKETVFADAVAVHEALTADLAGLAARGIVSSWSADSVHVYSERPWGEAGARPPLVHHARAAARADFVDVDALGAWIGAWGGTDGVEVSDVTWDVTDEHRPGYEAQVRRLAVADAVAKAEAYAAAVGKGAVTATQLADPGMLRGAPSRGATEAGFAAAPRMAKDGGGSLGFAPADIVLRVEVDATFVTD